MESGYHLPDPLVRIVAYAYIVSAVSLGADQNRKPAPDHDRVLRCYRETGAVTRASAIAVASSLLPADQGKLRVRLTKEAVHELCHTFGLRHCEDWQCLMASNLSVELVDVKPAEFCGDCARLVRVQTIKQSRRACQLQGANGNFGGRNSGR